jgi:regulator of protease activity HflC (stomatin/prohibitin superfamily)
MGRLQEKTLGLAALLMVFAIGLDALLGGRSHLLVVTGLFPFLITGLAVVLIVFARVRLARLSEEEKREQEHAERERPESALFERDEEFEPFTMARSREQLERYLVPVAAPLLAILQLFFAWRLHRSIGELAEVPAERLLTGSFLAGQAFVFFLLSRYMLGLGRDRQSRLMRGPGIYLGLACFASLLGTAACFLGETVYPNADRLAAWIMIVSLGVLGIENALATIAELYRPRHGERELNTAYETRLGALLTDPATWVRSVAQALDYQFGFGISQTWFYRFLQNALIPLVIFQLLVLYLLSCFVFLGPDEEGILEQLGKPLDRACPRGHLESGFHLKWPWPFETVRRFPAKRITRLHIGVSGEHDHGNEAMIWTIPHHEKKDVFVVASREETVAGGREAAVPVNFLSMHVPVDYRIEDVYKYAYNYADPVALLEQIAYRSITREAVGRGLFDFVGAGQLEITEHLKERIQAEADRLDMGVKIEFVGLQGVHPPVPVADAFESVVGALEEKEAAILEARAYTNGVLPLARADAEAELDTARSFKTRRIALAEAEAYRFEQRLKGYGKSPGVFRTDLYLRTLSEALTDARKYIISAVPSSEVIQFDFGEKLKPDLFDLGPSPREGKDQ